VLLVEGVLGLISAAIWVAVIHKQAQYMEFLRRTLRNLEYRIGELGVPLGYFSLEARVFAPPGTKFATPPKFPGLTINEQNDPTKTKFKKLLECLGFKMEKTIESLRFVKFDWSANQFPDKDTNKKQLYERAKVKGGMYKFDVCVAKGIICFWSLIITTLALFGTKIPYLKSLWNCLKNTALL